VKNGFSKVVLVLLFIAMSSTGAIADEKLMLFCGAHFKQPMDEITGLFREKIGIEINSNYASVGTLFSQIMLGKQGDMLILPSNDLMEKAKEKGLILPDSIKGLGYSVPAINIQQGNPKNIRTLKDLARPGIRVALGNPETVFIGTLGVEIVEKTLSSEEKNLFRKNVVAYAEDFPKLSSMLMLKQVDAIIGFHYLGLWYPDKVETVKFKPEEIQRISAGQASIISYSKNIPSARRFIDFLMTGECQAVFKKDNYFATPEEAFSWIGAKKPIGGEYTVPQDWIKR